MTITYSWPVDRSCLPALPDPDADGYVAAKADQDAAVATAVSVLWSLSGRQFGMCEAVIRPCVQQTDPLAGRYLFDGVWMTHFPIYWDGAWNIGWGCGCRAARCTYSGPRVVHLPGPVGQVTEVTVAGDVLDPSEYTLEGDKLYRDDADWPIQNLSAPLGAANTWSVTFTRGRPVPAGADKLVGALAGEFLSACSGSGKCRLPRNITSMSRNGVSYQVYDPAQMYSSGKTGLSEIDLWLSSVNPHALQHQPSVV